MQRMRLAGMLATTAAVAVGVLGPAGAASADPAGLTRIFTDPFTNTSSQHATAVEPDTFASGATIVMATQSGRFFDGGGSDIGFATTTNGGSTWTSGVLKGITPYAPGGGGTFARVSDPSVAFDARHNVWLISSIPITGSVTVPRVIVNRSTNGGVSWGTPVTVANAAAGQDFDKNWTACDNHPASPFYGRCYTTFDDSNNGDRLKVSTSTDGGLTWGPALNTGNNATGLGGQPVVQPNGTVIIPASDAFEANIIAFRSTNGGASWSNTVRVARALSHDPAGNLRSGPLPSAEIDAAGKVYVVWQDCRFRANCSGNDIVLSTSTDGLTWTTPSRVAIGTTGDGHDNFIPGLGVDVTTSGASARLGLTFYSYDVSACDGHCALKVRYIQSNNGGSTWSGVTTLAGPFGLNTIANTSQGRMVGDYISTSWATTANGRRAFGAFAVGRPSLNGQAFDEATFTPTNGFNSTGAFTASGAGAKVRPENEALLNANPKSAVYRRR
jgi:hypothetical protein